MTIRTDLESLFSDPVPQTGAIEEVFGVDEVVVIALHSSGEVYQILDATIEGGIAQLLEHGRSDVERVMERFGTR